MKAKNYNGRKTSLVYLEHNPFAPEVPCHRVIAADGTLCGFGGSRGAKALKRKRRLIDAEAHENAMPKYVL